MMIMKINKLVLNVKKDLHYIIIIVIQVKFKIVKYIIQIEIVFNVMININY